VNQGNGPDDPAQKDQPSQGRRITPLEGAFLLGSAFHQPNNRQSQSRPCVEQPGNAQGRTAGRERTDQWGAASEQHGRSEARELTASQGCHRFDRVAELHSVLAAVLGSIQCVAQHLRVASQEHITLTNTLKDFRLPRRLLGHHHSNLFHSPPLIAKDHR
jgi:hypothetical protein